MPSSLLRPCRASQHLDPRADDASQQGEGFGASGDELAHVRLGRDCLGITVSASPDWSQAVRASRNSTSLDSRTRALASPRSSARQASKSIDAIGCRVDCSEGLAHSSPRTSAQARGEGVQQVAFGADAGDVQRQLGDQRDRGTELGGGQRHQRWCRQLPLGGDHCGAEARHGIQCLALTDLGPVSHAEGFTDLLGGFLGDSTRGLPDRVAHRGRVRGRYRRQCGRLDPLFRRRRTEGAQNRESRCHSQIRTAPVRDAKQRSDGAESNRLFPKQVAVLFDRLLPALRAVCQQLREGDARVAELRIGGDGPTVGTRRRLPRPRVGPPGAVLAGKGRVRCAEIQRRGAHPRSW